MLYACSTKISLTALPSAKMEKDTNKIKRISAKATLTPPKKKYEIKAVSDINIKNICRTRILQSLLIVL